MSEGERERKQKWNNKNEIEVIATRSYKGKRINILIWMRTKRLEIIIRSR